MKRLTVIAASLAALPIALSGCGESSEAQTLDLSTDPTTLMIQCYDMGDYQNRREACAEFEKYEAWEDAANADYSKRVTGAERADEQRMWPGCGSCEGDDLKAANLTEDHVKSHYEWLDRRRATCNDASRPVLVRHRACGSVGVPFNAMKAEVVQ